MLPALPEAADFVHGMALRLHRRLCFGSQEKWRENYNRPRQNGEVVWARFL